MIVRLDEDGAVVRDADDCGRLHLETDLDEHALHTALKITATGAAIDADTAWLDLGVLRTRARLVATEPDWDERWSAMVDHAEAKGWLSDDGHAVQVHVERVGAA
ncbi:hypothetical protein WEH80_31300 [Actinomycetes bacterium KLBMP 9759]